MTSDFESFVPPHNMSLRDKLAQLMFVRIGSNLPPIRTVEEDEERTLELLAECPVGGLLLFNGGPATKALLERLQRAATVPLLVAADIERGVGQQVRGYTLFPHAMAFGRLGGGIGFFVETIVREARDAGIHITLGPVADVNTNSRNPIIATRAFSEDPEQAAHMTAHYVKVAEESGLLTVPKHFPGHGDTQQDSHDTLPSVPRSLDELRVRELLPFQAGINAGCSLIMTAHVAFPRIDPSGLPATLSPILLQQLLRTEMGFEGAVCSDSLLMAGVRDRFASEGEMALAALTAGVDLLLDIREPVNVVDHLRRCVADGTLEEGRVNQAFTRLWALKRKAFERLPVDLPVLRSMPSTMTLDELTARLATSLAGAAIEVLGGNARELPLNPDQTLVAILLKPFASPSDPPEQPLADALRRQFRDVQYIELGPQADAAALDAARQLALGGVQLLVAMIIKPAAWHSLGLLPAQRELVERLTREREAVLVSLGVPYALQDYPDAKVRICTYSDVPVSQRAVVDFLLGM